MLSLKIGIPLAKVREMSSEDYNAYLAVLDASEHISKSIIKRK